MPVGGTGKKAIEAIFAAAVQARASDVHLVADREPFVRVHGELRPVSGTEPLSPQAIEELVFSLLTPEQRTRFEKERELDFAYGIQKSRFRCNAHYERDTVGLVARLIPLDIPSPEELLLPEVIVGLTDLPHGLVLLTGPTGSGKSTTLASLIQRINTTTAKHIMTLEDPIEFIFPEGQSLIRQRQLGSDMISFAEGLKHLLRQDPNVVMIGEMRDLETIATTLTLAETGHLVFATLHTYSAATTIERVIDVFPPHQQNQIRLQLASVLRAVVVQQLLPKRGGGRVAAREVLLNTPASSNMIREGKANQLTTILQTSSKIGMYTLDQDLKRLVGEKVIEQDVANRLVLTPKNQTPRL